MSGFLSSISFIASFMQSAGVPEVLYSICGPSSIFSFLQNRVLFIVIACPIALCGLSGATTTTSPILFITFINDLNPGAVIPSSFVINIKGFFFIFTLY